MKLGVSGHQNLGDAATVAWVAKRIERFVQDRRPAAGITCLAVGADQVFARVLESAQVPLWAVLPSAQYETSFTTPEGLEEYRRLLSLSVNTVVLPFDSPGEEAYLLAGQRVVEMSDLMIAVWNGAPAQGKGGTADIVAYGQIHGKPLYHIDPHSRRCGMLA